MEGGQMDRLTDRQMDRQTEGCTDGYMNRWTDKQKYIQMDI
jgi:hypothetical protein